MPYTNVARQRPPIILLEYDGIRKVVLQIAVQSRTKTRQIGFSARKGVTDRPKATEYNERGQGHSGPPTSRLSKQKSFGFWF